MKATADEEKFLKEFRSGKDTALTKLYESYARNLIFYSFRITKDQQQAEDIVANGFIKLWDKRAHFDAFDSIKNFLIVEVKNKSIDFYRRLKRQADKHAEILDSSDDVIYNEYIRAELLEYLHQILGLLTPLQRVIITETLLNGATAKEVAEQLEIKLGELYKERRKALEIMQAVVRERNMDYPSLLLYILILTEIARPSSN